MRSDMGIYSSHRTLRASTMSLPLPDVPVSNPTYVIRAISESFSPANGPPNLLRNVLSESRIEFRLSFLGYISNHTRLVGPINP